MVQLLLALIYLAFVGLGLPASLLSSAWPAMYQEMNMPVSASGLISIVICIGTILANLMSYRLMRRFGPGKVTAFSGLALVLTLLAFSLARSFPVLVLCALPYGLSTGSIDTCLNNYVANHYASHYMNWLHCMWGVGASISPYIMASALTGAGWAAGYRRTALILACLTAVFFLALPLWKKSAPALQQEQASSAPLTFRDVFAIPGVPIFILLFFCYYAFEQVVFFWASTHLVLHHAMVESQAAALAGLLSIGTTVGRALGGLLSLKFNDHQMIRLGFAVAAVGLIVIALPAGGAVLSVGLFLIGFGTAPIYPSLLHATPGLFGTEQAQAIIGVQMAAAFLGSLVMSPLFGVLADLTTHGIFVPYLAVLLVITAVMHTVLLKKVKPAVSR